MRTKLTPEKRMKNELDKAETAASMTSSVKDQRGHYAFVLGYMQSSLKEAYARIDALEDELNQGAE